MSFPHSLVCLISSSLLGFHGVANYGKSVSSLYLMLSLTWNEEKQGETKKQREAFQAEKKATGNSGTSPLLGETREREQTHRYHVLHRMLSPLGKNNKNKKEAGYGGSETERSTVAPFLFDHAGFLQLESHLHAKSCENLAKCETRPAKRAWVFKFRWSWCELQSCYSAPSLRRSTSAQTKSPQQLWGTVLHLIKLADVPAVADTEQVREQLQPSKAAKLLG